MAAAYSPHRVTFLFVDYKGGAAFADCVQLPHTVGLVTDLSPHLVRRALTSLRAELHHRERLLNRHKAKDLLELERRGETRTRRRSLIIVVDEFAALATEVPEFVDGVVDVAARGRSLGLHLILATQRPAGVIKDNLRANTNLRVALRMADEDDAIDVLGVPTAAAFFDPAHAGSRRRQDRPGRLVPFQTGYAGGWTTDKPPPPDMKVESWPSAPASSGSRRGAEGAGEAADLGPTDIQRLVGDARPRRPAGRAPRPRKPWLDDCAPSTTSRPCRRSAATTSSSSVSPTTPTTRTSRRSVPPRPDGNIAIYGTGGLRQVGRSCAHRGRGRLHRAWRARATSTVSTSAPRAWRCSRRCRTSGAIVRGDDHERVTRLLRLLRATIDERASRYSAVSAATITDYRRLADRPDEPRIIVLVDGMTAFRQAYEVGGRFQWLDLLAGRDTEV